MKTNAKLFIGPMSLNIVDSIIEYSNENNINIGLIPSRRQVEFDGGYVNKWTTNKFCEYVRGKTDKVCLVRDHGGPLQGINIDDGFESLADDIKNNIDIIHIDVWKKFTDLNDGIIKTIEYINYCNNVNPKTLYEVGTEQSIRNFTEDELYQLLSSLKRNLKKDVFNKIKFVVIQSGTALLGNQNVGSYDKDRLISMVNVVKQFDLLTKEHNGDYLPVSLIKEKFNLGLDSINIAPEFGQIETNFILEKIQDDKKSFELLYKLCYESRKWEKWVSSNFIPEQNKKELIRITGHYIFSNTEFLKLKSDLDIKDLEIKSLIKKKISTFYE